MTEPEDPQQRPHRETPPILDYRTPGVEPGISKFQVFGGAFLSTAALMAAVFIGVLGSIGSQSPWFAIFVIGGALVGVICWVVALKRKAEYRGLVIGLLLGIGVTILIEGLCFMGFG